MQVHQVECDSTLEVSVDSVDVNGSSNVDDLAVAEMRFRDGFVDGLVLSDSLPEVDLGGLLRHVLVVRISRRDLESDVGSDDGGFVADGLEEEEVEVGFEGDPSFDLGSVGEAEG